MKKLFKFTPPWRGKQKNKAFTLVETLVAISIFTASILSLISILASGISDTNYAKNKVIASYLAQEGIEYIRNMRDTYTLYSTVPPNNDWGTFRVKLNPCIISSKCGFDSSVSMLDSNFIFKCNPGDCKLYVNNNGGYDSDSSGVDSGFVRKVWADVIDPNKEIKIFSDVSWTQGSGSHNITFSENLFNWME